MRVRSLFTSDYLPVNCDISQAPHLRRQDSAEDVLREGAPVARMA
jgi:hypothetical protein